MKYLIAFCVGMIILVSGDELGAIMDITYISLVCNCIGAILIGLAVKEYADKYKEETKRKWQNREEIKNMMEKLPLSLQIERIEEYLEQTCENQKKHEQEIYNIGEIIKHFEEKYEAMVFTADKMQVCVDTILKTIAKLCEKMDQNASNICEEVGLGTEDICQEMASQREILLNITKRLLLLCEQEEEKAEMLKGSIDTMRNDLLEDYDNQVDLIRNITNKFEEKKESELEEIRKIQQGLTSLNKLPECTMDVLEEFSEKMKNYFLEFKEQMKELLSNIEKCDKKRMNDFKNMMAAFENMMENLEEYNEGQSDNLLEYIKELSGQYQEFKSFSEILVQKMTDMTKKDCEIMRGFLDGRIN